MEAEKIAFGEKLRDAQWLAMAAEVFRKDENFCQSCGKSDDLEVHFFSYPSAEPWNVPLSEMTALCKRCHELEHVTRGAIEKLFLDSLERTKFLSIDLIELLPHVIMTFQSRHERLSDYRMKRLTARTREVTSQPEISEYIPDMGKVAEQIWSRMDEPGFMTSEDFFDLHGQFTGMQTERMQRAEALYKKIGSIVPPDPVEVTTLLHSPTGVAALKSD